ncbi:hypothetical protein LEL_08767 [Akanthomyces lecanii RCEF 1005]|uniref:Uncharacterized protein n=1 Tax=Akanthomyces lecanii RCEF 1005 TaxID=1081108 RepID=A0A168DTE2_CORDF|nr:hypothetical protein LEL_08767 [Akanthomyces lecanii RCEF 1005]
MTAADDGSGIEEKSSSTAYGQIVANGQATVTFASAINDLIGLPLSTYFSKQSAESKYLAKLGEWASEAVDSQGRLLQPMLRIEAFEKHLIEEEGCLKPQDTCDSNLAWAQLLYALNIRPGMKVLTWRQPTKVLQLGVDELRLIVDGAVLCHIVNLYRIYTDCTPPGIDETNQCQFLFGTIKIDPITSTQPRDAKRFASFEPWSLLDLKLEKAPFQCDGYGLRQELKFDKSAFMAKYLTTIYNQLPLVDAVGIGSVPPPNGSLKERCDYFLQAVKLIAGNWSKPCVITRAWLNDIERIKRRVTTNGGDDNRFLEFLVLSLLKRPGLDAHNDGLWREFVCQKLRSSLLFTNDHISLQRQTIIGSDEAYRRRWRRRLYEDTVEEEKILSEVPFVLANIPEDYRDAWFYEFSAIKEEVKSMLETAHTFDNAAVIVLELGPSHSFWKSLFEIREE